MADPISPDTWRFKKEGSGPSVLFLHGFLGTSADWHPSASALRARHTCILVDIPGSGHRSPVTGPLSLERLAGSLAEEIRRSLTPPVSVVGYSLGGRLALALAAAEPAICASLVLESCSPGIDDPAERRQRLDFDRTLADLIRREGLEAFLDRWYAAGVFESLRNNPALLSKIRARRSDTNEPEAAATLLESLSPGAMPSYWGVLGAVQCPVLLLSGGLDPKFTAIASKMQGLMPRSMHLIIEDAGHTVHAEQPERFIDALRGFLPG